MDKAVISGTGMYVPPRRVSNFDLTKLMDTSDEWIFKRSGIKFRHYVEDDVCTSDLAVEAAKLALNNSNNTPKDIDLIIASTLSPDHHFPGIGVKIQHKLGLETTPAIDIRNQCSGFIYSLSIANAMIASGQYKKVLVIGAEIHSKLLNFSTAGRDVTVLFGDGAGAVVLEKSPSSERGFQDFLLYSQGEFANRLWVERPGTSGQRFIDNDDLSSGLQFPYMDGKYVFKHATTRLTEAVRSILERNQMSVADVDHFLFHQANIRINEHVGQTLGIPSEKVHNNIENYGNCSAASLPILLDEYVKKGVIKPGQQVCLGAFGAGFTWATALMKF